MNRIWRSFLILAAALLLLTGLLSEGAFAEEDYRLTNEIVLAEVRISPMSVRGRAQITFLLENRSAEPISFGGITLTDARCSRIVASVGNGATTTLGSVSVAAGDILPADGVALWIEVDGLAKELSPGGDVNATVSLGDAVLSVSLTVDRVSEPSN